MATPSAEPGKSLVEAKTSTPEKPKPQSEDAKKDKTDVVLVHGRTDDGALKVLRAREDRLEAGTVRNLEPGKPIHGEVVKLTPRKDTPLICDVETTLDCRPEAGADSAAESLSVSHGPAQVANDTYRSNWEHIWKNRTPSSELN